MSNGKKIYTTNDITKNKIIDAATTFFYDQGYTNTYFEQIAEECRISSPLISYHFKRKSFLAKAVSDKYTRENKNSIAFKIYKQYYEMQNYDLQLSTFVEIMLTNQLYYEDPKVFRFIKERADAHYEDIQSKNAVNLYKIHDRHYHLPINANNDEISMLAYSASGATLALTLAYFRGDIDCSFEDFNDYATSLHFRLMRIDEKRIEELLSESKKLIKQLKFEFKPYFKII